MSDLDDLLKKHRQQIVAREEQAFREMLAAYEDIQRELKLSIRELVKKIKEAKAEGKVISPSWLYRQRRLRALLDQVEEQIVRFGKRVSPIVAREQQAAIRMSVRQTNELYSVTMGPAQAEKLGMLMNPAAVETAVGMMGNGSPLLSYFEEQLAPKIAQKIKAEIVKAAALGTAFDKVARRLENVGGITRDRALTFARTEVSRVRRETQRQRYLADSDVIQGWEWAASSSLRTCPVCLAMDGKVFKLTEPFPGHPRCRCTMIPVLIGVPRPRRKLGSEWFEELDDERKEKILGQDAAAAYARGEFELKDLVGWKTDRRFGKSVYRKPLTKVVLESEQ